MPTTEYTLEWKIWEAQVLVPATQIPSRRFPTPMAAMDYAVTKMRNGYGNMGQVECFKVWVDPKPANKKRAHCGRQWVITVD